MLRVVQVVRQQQCNGHCLCDCSSTAVETELAQCTSRWAMARGHRLNTSIVLAAVHGLSGLFRAVSAVEPSLFRPLPTDPVPNKPSRFGSIAKSSRLHFCSISLRLSFFFKKAVVSGQSCDFVHHFLLKH